MRGTNNIENIDLAFIRRFSPRRFDNFDYCTSLGASRGILELWNGTIFLGLPLINSLLALLLASTHRMIDDLRN